MSIFSSPASVPAKREDEIQPDPAIVKAREAAQAATDVANAKTADEARKRQLGRTMGTEGANALFTSGPSGYAQRTMGSANI